MTERDVTDLLKPDEVRRIKEVWWPNFQKLCRDYLTLWDELEYERELHDNAVKRVTQLEQMMGALGR